MKPKVDVEVIQVIHITSLLGKGTDEDYISEVHSYYDLKGNLLWYVDPMESEQNEN